MVAPDCALVAEVTLFAEGISDARRLAGKMTALYRIAEEQLSRQVWWGLQGERREGREGREEQGGQRHAGEAGC
jgi:hypothetical protein